MSTLVENAKQLSQRKPLQGKVALVTGAARGIGRAIAFELASRGAIIALNFRSSAAEAEAAKEELKQNGVDCLLVKGDLAQPQEARRVVKEVLDAYKRVDILVNNAGITRDRSLRRMDDRSWSEVIDTNLNGTYFCTSAALPSMIEQKWGRIVNISSVVGQSGAFGQANYAASKGGIIAFTKVIALEMARFNITANAVAPGYTATEMVQGIPEDVLKQICAKIPNSLSPRAVCARLKTREWSRTFIACIRSRSFTSWICGNCFHGSECPTRAEESCGRRRSATLSCPGLLPPFRMTALTYRTSSHQRLLQFAIR